MLAHAIGTTWEERVFQCMRQLEGAYSIVVQTKDSMIAARDPLGIRPLCLGKLNGGWIVASESCALDHLGAEYLREVEPGEVVIVDGNGLHTATWPGGTGRRSLCVFELIYFARPDSVMDGQLEHSARQELGAQLDREHTVEADLVNAVSNTQQPLPKSDLV